MMMSKPPDYLSYLLRVWRDNARPSWQASLRSTATGQIHHFADVEQMWDFLLVQMAGAEDDQGAGDVPPGEAEPGAPD
jgi:hypothetical protein